MMGFARGLALLYTGGAPLTGFGALFRFPGTGRFGGVPVPGTAFRPSPFSRFSSFWSVVLGWSAVRSVGSNSVAAWGSGIDVPGTVAKAYVLSGTLAALAGLVLVGRLDSAQPSAGLGYEFGAIAGVVLGGTSFSGGQGTLAGTIVGVLIMGVLENGMNLLNVNPFSEQVVKGVVIAAALVAYGSLGRRSRVAG